MSGITKNAKGQPCQMRLEGICNFNPETTVAAHYRMHGLGSGVGRKPSDLFTAHLCSSCHDAADGRACSHDRDIVRLRFAEAVFRTQAIGMASGAITVT